MNSLYKKKIKLKILKKLLGMDNFDGSVEVSQTNQFLILALHE